MVLPAAMHTQNLRLPTLQLRPMPSTYPQSKHPPNPLPGGKPVKPPNQSGRPAENPANTGKNSQTARVTTPEPKPNAKQPATRPLTPTTIAQLTEQIATRVVQLLNDSEWSGRSTAEAKSGAPGLQLEPRARTRVHMNGELVDATTVAKALGVSRRFVYEHRDELGCVTLGSGKRPRLRFDLEAARAAVACLAGRDSSAGNASDDGQPQAVRRRTRHRLPNGLPEPGSVLAIKPRKAA
jgi:hypothetical protein